MKFNDQKKIEWQGTIVSIQPRTTVWRYRLDNRTHYHRGYNLFVDGEANGITTRFSVAISEKQQQKLMFRIGDVSKGSAWIKLYAWLSMKSVEPECSASAATKANVFNVRGLRCLQLRLNSTGE